MRALNDTAASLRALVTAYVALLLLLGATLALSFVPLGPYNLPAALGIGTLKAAIIVWIFMEINRATAIVRLVAAAGLVWLGIMFALTFSDYLTRWS